MSQSIQNSISLEEAALLGAATLMVGSAVLLGSQIAGGVVLGGIVSAGAVYTICKTRTHAPKVWNFIQDHPIKSDIVIDTGLVIIVGGTTLTGLVGAASASVFTSMALCGIRRLGKVEIPPKASSFLDRFKTNKSVVVMPA